MEWINMLSWWQWALLGAVPPALVALYFLKLRRQPLEVPSTFLWKRSIEDLSVNSLWQRLRRNLLLLLQLLVVAALDGGRAAAELAIESALRRAVYFSRRHFGQHERHRRGSESAGGGQTPRRRD